MSRLTICLVALAAFVCVSEAVVKRRPWYADFLPRYQYRRNYWCAGIGQACSMERKCCSHQATCLLEMAEDRWGQAEGLVSRCREVTKGAASGGSLKTGESCTTSLECADRCCRETHAGRGGRQLRCGAQQEDDLTFHNCV